MSEYNVLHQTNSYFCIGKLQNELVIDENDPPFIPHFTYILHFTTSSSCRAFSQNLYDNIVSAQRPYSQHYKIFDNNEIMLIN